MKQASHDILHSAINNIREELPQELLAGGKANYERRGNEVVVVDFADLAIRIDAVHESIEKLRQLLADDPPRARAAQDGEEC